MIDPTAPWHGGGVVVRSRVAVTRLSLLGLGLLLGACGAREDPDGPAAVLDLADDPHAYVTSTAYRRAILERDLIRDELPGHGEPVYVRVRLRHYATVDDPDGWDAVPVVDWPTLPLTVEDAAAIAVSGQIPALEFGPGLADGLDSDSLPDSQDEWIALGERVFFEYPMSPIPSLGEALREGLDLRDYGVIEHEGAYVGVRFVARAGRTGIAVTCASCHASVDEDGWLSGVRANRNYDLGRFRLDHGGAGDHHAVDATSDSDLAKLGPGRSDVQHDGQFNPYAFPDFGGIADMAYLHHTGNWANRGVATLAIRVETVFMTGGRVSSRPPRVLMWALAEYLRSLPAPAPLAATAAPSLASERGRLVFEAEGCDGCHTPPFYTSSARVAMAAIGTDPAAGLSPLRGTGYWRVPSLRGVGGNAPYLHHGAFASLEAMFAADRIESGQELGHGFGLALDAADRADLLTFLRTL